MRITDLLKKQTISLNPEVSTKNEAIDFLVDLMDKGGNISDKEVYRQGVYDREAQGTTGIGEGVAIPHSKNSAVKEAGLASMIVKDGLDFDSLDGTPAHIFFLIAAPDTEANVHLEVLARLSTLLMDKDFRQRLIDAKDVDEYLNIIDEAEKNKFPDEPVAEEKAEEADGAYDLLAVTACPTGIAHTYMAAEALEQKAAELGVKIKVETNGSGGIKNALTKEEIEGAKAIIVAADKKVEMARFDGKKVIQTKVANGIHKAEELINDAMAGKANIYHADAADTEAADDGENESIGRKIYKDLMNGISHMLPFVIGGGILIALAFLFDDPSLGEATFGSNTPFAAFLKSVGDTAFGFMLPVLAGFIAMSIADRPGLVVGFVGGAMASAGGSGFLGALFAGFAAGYLMQGIKKVLNKLPEALEGLKPILLYPFLGVLLTGAMMQFIINPPVALLNTAMTNALNSMGQSSAILLGAVLGGMMAIDMGGPFNKAAYVFGTASLAMGNYTIMASVMIGGMVPPVAIALCATFFKNKFTESDRKSAMTGYIMGASFITEGAIPFAAADPLRVIPSCIIGSGLAGALSAAFGCELMAPHGGLFVIGIIKNPLMYIVAWLVGSAVAALILGFIKKPVEEK